MSALLLVIAANSNRGIDTLRTIEGRVARQADIDSIVDLVIYEIARDGVRSKWLRKPLVFAPAPAPYDNYMARVVDVRGLIDLNDGAIHLVRSALGNVSHDVSRRWNGRSGIRYKGLADFAFDAHLAASELFCLSINATVHSRHPSPAPELAPESARHLIERRFDEPASILEEGGGSAAGRTFQMIVLATDFVEAYEVTAYLTGRADSVYLVREAMWLPAKCPALERGKRTHLTIK